MGEGFGINRKESIGHLEQGVKPIDFSVVSFDQLSPADRTMLENKFDPAKSLRVHNVNWDNREIQSLLRMGFLTGGWRTYIISPLDDFNKTSDGFARCTSLVVSGQDKKTGQDVSFVTHQDPATFLFAKREEFLRDLRIRLQEVVARCKPRTIDAVILGGKYLQDYYFSDEAAKEAYINSVELLGREVENALKFDPLVKDGPKVDIGKDGIYYENEGRRGYFVRPAPESGVGQSFRAGDVRKQAQDKKWR